MPAIEVEDLFKSYGPVDAVRGISFTVEEGESVRAARAEWSRQDDDARDPDGHRRRSGGPVSVLVDP